MLKIESGDLLFSPNQYTKYQDSISITFWDILLVSNFNVILLKGKLL